MRASRASVLGGPALIWLSVVIAAASALAMASARPYASGWNDGSRLATVESLVDERTFAIEHSIFAQVSLAENADRTPYNPAAPAGTLDKILVNGHFYSDKSAVPAVGMAAIYAVLQKTTGIVARRQPAAFCYWMTVLTSGTSYVAAVVAVFLFAIRILRAPAQAALIAASFGLATTSIVYARAVNIHVVLLAISAWTTVLWDQIGSRNRANMAELVALGLLGGAAYTGDFGIGPHLLLVSVGVVWWRSRRISAVAIVAGAAAPLVMLNHALNYAIGGTLAPVSTIPGYFAWPGSVFDAASLTGRWNHPTATHALRYGVALLVGADGFVFHNMPLLLAGPAVASIWTIRRTTQEWPTVTAVCAFVPATWVTYAALSTNYAGVSASIRWFLPWLAPVYFILCVWLRAARGAWIPLAAVSVIGAFMTLAVWPDGPWARAHVPFYSGWVAAAVLIVIAWMIAVASDGRFFARNGEICS